MAFMIVFALFMLQANAEKRLLLNDPDVILSQLHALERKMEDMNAWKADMTAKYTDLSVKYNTLSGEYNTLSGEYNTLSVKYNTLSTQTNEMQAKIVKIPTQMSESSTE